MAEAVEHDIRVDRGLRLLEFVQVVPEEAPQRVFLAVEVYLHRVQLRDQLQPIVQLLVHVFVRLFIYVIVLYRVLDRPAPELVGPALVDQVSDEPPFHQLVLHAVAVAVEDGPVHRPRPRRYDRHTAVLLAKLVEEPHERVPEKVRLLGDALREFVLVLRPQRVVLPYLELVQGRLHGPRRGEAAHEHPDWLHVVPPMYVLVLEVRYRLLIDELVLGGYRVCLEALVVRLLLDVLDLAANNTVGAVRELRALVKPRDLVLVLFDVEVFPAVQFHELFLYFILVVVLELFLPQGSDLAGHNADAPVIDVVYIKLGQLPAAGRRGGLRPRAGLRLVLEVHVVVLVVEDAIDTFEKFVAEAVHGPGDGIDEAAGLDVPRPHKAAHYAIYVQIRFVAAGRRLLAVHLGLDRRDIDPCVHALPI